MSKKIIILIIIILLLIVGGAFWWWDREKEEQIIQIFEPVIYASKDDYIIKKVQGEKIIENKKAGLKMKVPEEWGVKIEELGGEEVVVNFLEPGAKRDPVAGLLIQGCGWGVAVKYSKTRSELISSQIKMYQDELNDRTEVIEINNHQALKEILLEDPDIGQIISIQIPVDDKIYFFETIFIPGDKERCVKKFNEFLATILIQ